MPLHDSAFLEDLDRHERRRGEGIPTLSILVGPPEQTLVLWDQWAHQRQFPVVVVEHESASAIVTAWARALAQARDLTADAEAYAVLHNATSEPRRQFLIRGKTSHERRVLLESLPATGPIPNVWEFCRLLLEAPSGQHPGSLPEALHRNIEQDPGASLSALLALTPAGHAPALRLRETSSLFHGLRSVVALCSSAPVLTAVCALSHESFAACVSRAESRVVAMIREGRLELETSPRVIPSLSTVLPTLVRMQQEGMPEPLLTLYAEAAQAMNSAHGRQAEDRARSAAERFLYEQLRHYPATQGLFELNAPLDLGNNGRLLEVDLLCRKLKLAVEIDGYYHFQSRDAYRRDRSKDVALQRAGYWILRVLAEDVVDRLESILSTLTRLINDRRRHASQDES